MNGGRHEQVEGDESASDGSSDEEVAFPSERLRNPDGTATTATPQELHILASLKKQTSFMAAGRFVGRAGKLARLQAQEAQTVATALEPWALANNAGQTAAAQQPATLSTGPCNTDPPSFAVRVSCPILATSAAGVCQNSYLQQEAADMPGYGKRRVIRPHEAGDKQDARAGLLGRTKGMEAVAPPVEQFRQDDRDERQNAGTWKEESGRGGPVVSLRSSHTTALSDDGPDEKLRRNAGKGCGEMLQSPGSNSRGDGVRSMKKRKKKGAGGGGEGEELGGGSGLTTSRCQVGAAAGRVQHEESLSPLATGRLDQSRTSHSPSAIAGAETCTGPLQWWGSSKFVSGGLLEGLDHAAASTSGQGRQMFDESTQEALYIRVQGGKTANKRGLGTRDLPREAPAWIPSSFRRTTSKMLRT